MSDFSSILRLARANNISDDIKSIIRNLVQITYAMSSPKNFGIRLAALFDLCVSCRYYANVANKGWTYCNLISNVHAVRHQTEYLASIKDIIWTIDKSRRMSEWSELPPGTSLYNLFDGIISLTFSDIRDPQLKQLFNFSEQ